MIQSLPLWAVDKVYFMLENFLLDVVNFWIIIAKCSTYWFSSHFVSCQWTYWVSTCYRKATDAEDCRVNPQAPWKDQEAGARQHFNCSRTFKIRKGRKKEKVMMQAIFSRRLSRPVRAFSLHSNLGHDKQIPCKLWLLYIFILSQCYFHIGVLSFSIRQCQCHHFAAKSHWLCLKHGLVNWNFSPLHFFCCSWQLESGKIWLK